MKKYLSMFVTLFLLRGFASAEEMKPGMPMANDAGTVKKEPVKSSVKNDASASGDMKNHEKHKDHKKHTKAKKAM